MNGYRTYQRILLGTALGGTLAGTLGSGLFYAREVEPADVEVVSVSLILPRLDERFDGYRIAHISDVHAESWMTPGRLLELVNLVNDEEPDLVAITGDFATYSPLRSMVHYVTGLAAPLRRLHAPDGVLAVLGNHDHKEDAEIVRRVLAESGATELRNTVRTLHRGEAALHLCGVDSVMEGRARLDQVLEKLPERGAAIILAHEPNFANASAWTNCFDLQLSGHSHGGQINLPFLDSPFMPPLCRRYPSGLYRVDGMFLYTNRGLGAHPRFRFNCRPEVTVLTLHAQNSGGA